MDESSVMEIDGLGETRDRPKERCAKTRSWILIHQYCGKPVGLYDDVGCLVNSCRPTERGPTSSNVVGSTLSVTGPAVLARHKSVVGVWDDCKCDVVRACSQEFASQIFSSLSL